MARDPRAGTSLKPRSSGGSGSSVNARKPPKLTGKGRKVPLPTDICWRCGKSRHQKGQHCKALEAVCRSCGTKGHYEKVCMKKSTHLVDVPGTSTNSGPDYFDEHGEPVYAHALMVNAKAINKKKHLIQFPISVNLEKVRKPAEGPCPTVLLKADTGADVNLLNSTTFDRIIGDRSILQPSTLRMEAYGNSTVSVLGKFYAFLRWKGRVYRQLFYITTANASPNLLSRDGCYTLGVLKPCYSVEASRCSSRFQGKPQVKPTQPKTDLNQSKMHGDSSHHLRNEGTEEEKLSHSTQWSLYKEQLQGMPLKKQDILRVYSDVFTGIGKFPGPPYKFQLKPNAKPARHALR